MKAYPLLPVKGVVGRDRFSNVSRYTPLPKTAPPCGAKLLHFMVHAPKAYENALQYDVISNACTWRET